MYDKLIEAGSHWLEATSPARKVADIAVAFLLAFMAGSLYLAYNAESDIRRLAIKALDKSPEIDADRAKQLAGPLFADCQKAGAIAVAVFKVDLAANTTRLVSYAGPEQFRDKFPRLKSGFDKVPFIFPGMPESQVEIASSMMTGVPEIAYYPAADVTLIVIPIPDKAGQFLAGFVMAALPGKVADEAPAISNIRLLLSEFSSSVL